MSSAVCAPPYFITGIPQNSYVDLGVIIDSKLSFESHVSSIVSKARQRVSILFRGFVTCNLYVIRQAFVTYIRPILEYNSIVWNPSFIFLIDLIESVQRNFSKHIPYLSSLPYLERLALLDL
jgi:hypothetical protein